MIRPRHGIMAGWLCALAYIAPARAANSSAAASWTSTADRFVHTITAAPTRWHGCDDAAVRSLVRESARGRPAVVSRLSMPAATVTPAIPPAGAYECIPRIDSGALVSLLAIIVAAIIVALLVAAALRVRFMLAELARGQLRLARLETRLLDMVSTLATAPPARAQPAPPDGQPLARTRDTEPDDHRLALTLSNEITKMQRRVAELDPAAAAAKALDRALQRLRRELMAQGYTLYDPTGQAYTKGMRVSVAEFVPGGEPGDTERIERTIKAEVRYGETVIQPAVVIVKTHRPAGAGCTAGTLAAEHAAVRLA